MTNNIYRIIPVHAIIFLHTRKLSKSFNKYNVKMNLIRLLGDFADFKNCAIKKKGIIELANTVLERKFDILGSGQVILNEIDWSVDFKSGFRWKSGKFYKDYIQVDLTNNADIKVPREFSRSHHLIWLGQAYLITHDEKYTQEFISLVYQWINDNPLMRSINWGCAMDVAIRATNWIYALNMFIDSELIKDEFIRVISISLFEHGFFIENNLEKSFPDSNNHYAANITGLLYLGLLYYETNKGKRWFDFAKKEYYKEIRSQVLPSGPHFERSTSYHRLMTEIFFYPYLVLKRNNNIIPLDIGYRIKTMCDFVLYYTKPDGTAPLIGDNDNGRLLAFDNVLNDHRYLLAIAAAEFRDPHFKKYSNGICNDLFFVFGGKGINHFIATSDISDELTSKSFIDTGFVIIRNKGFYLFVNNSGIAKYPDQSNSFGSHAHADFLSFELANDDISFVVDPGTYVYTSNPEMRNRFRSTRMHNTITVDDLDQHNLPFNNIFRTTNIGFPDLMSYNESDSTIRVEGSHTGYYKIQKGLKHNRLFHYNKINNELFIWDTIQGTGLHKISIYFHLNSYLDIVVAGSKKVVVQHFTKKQMILEILSDTVLNIVIQDDLISKSYGTIEYSKTIIYNSTLILPTNLGFKISFKDEEQNG